MKGYKENIENLTLENKSFRQVLYTSHHMQLVLMSLPPDEEIGEEVHEGNDQFLRFENGEGVAVIDGVKHHVQDGDVVIVPSGATHNIINTSSTEDLKLYSLYSPPHHKDGIVHPTKAKAESDDEEFDGETSEPLPKEK